MEHIGTMRIKKRKDVATAWAFLAPMIVGFLFFTAFPLVYAIVMSFTEYHLFDTPVFIGWDNYVAAFQDEYFKSSLVNACINAIGVPIGILISLLLASLSNLFPRIGSFFRTLYFIPTICGAVAITFIWQWMYAPLYGLLPTFFASIGLPNINFLGKDYFLPSMIVMGLWSGIGTSLLLLFAALKNVPNQLYEAADVDGANFFQKFIHVTLPGVSPITFYCLITGISGSFQDFTRFQVMRGGSYSTWNIMPVWWIYQQTTTFGDYNVGYASALGVILGLIIVALSTIQFVLARWWVHYD
jgi:multiple sugar transport system permease protein